MEFHDLTLLSDGEIWGNDSERQLEVIKKYGVQCALTDLAILTGAYVSDEYHIEEDKGLTGKVGYLWTRSDDGDNDICVVDDDGLKRFSYRCKRIGCVRPALKSSVIFDKLFANRIKSDKGIYEVEYGEYPQYASSKTMQETLESEYQSKNLIKTGKSYTFDSKAWNDYDNGFSGVTYEEYKYEGKKYIRIKAISRYNISKFQLSNGEYYVDGNYVWVEVSPVVWLVDEEAKTLVTKKGLVSGIRYLEKDTPYKGDFNTTEMKEFLDEHMAKDLFQTSTLENIIKEDENKTIEEVYEEAKADFMKTLKKYR